MMWKCTYTREMKQTNELNDEKGEELVEKTIDLCEKQVWESNSALNMVSYDLET